MSGEFTIGMKFGSYDKKTSELGKKYNTESRTNNRKMQSEYLYTSKKKGIVGNAYREAMQFDDYGNAKYVDAVLFFNNYQYGVRAKEWENLDKFDYIQGASEHAVDLNENGKVDEGEIFEGRIDLKAYEKAKESGSLSKYAEFLKQFTPSWLKSK